MFQRSVVLLISTGGTITMTARADGAGVTPTLQAKELAAQVPGLADVADVAPLSLARKASASLAPADVVRVAREIFARLDGAQHAPVGAVVAQGTDTIEETAFILSLLLPSSLRVVVTGAMRPPETAGADGPANLLAAARVATAPETVGLGPVVVLNDEIHAARTVQKGHTALPSAFMSPGAGPLGLVSEGAVHLAMRPAQTSQTLGQLLGMADADVLALLGAEEEGATSETGWPPVALLRIGLGDDGRLLAATPDLGFAGVVIEGAGAGHVPEAMADIVSDIARRIPVVLASRVAAGPSFSRTYGYAGSEIDLLRRGAVSAGRLAGLKARLLLQMLLRTGVDAARLRAAISTLAE